MLDGMNFSHSGCHQVALVTEQLMVLAVQLAVVGLGHGACNRCCGPDTRLSE